MLRALTLLALGGILPLLTPAAPADAQERRIYPFCFVQYGPHGAQGSYQCGFTSFAQCMATASGVGGQCEQNPELVAQAQRAPQPRKPAR
jgi:hypothetical protein